MVEVYLLGFPNTTWLEEVGLGDLLLVFRCAVGILQQPEELLGSCNAESMVWRQKRHFLAQVQGIPKVLGCQEYPAASIFGFS